MENVNCDLCGADDPVSIIDRVDRFTGEEFQLATCSHCGLIYLPIRPTADELANFYPDEYEAYYLLGDRSDSQQWHLRRALTRQLKLVQSFNPDQGNLLDVGCATGNFMKIARENGWQVLGIEPIEKAAQLARENYQLEVITGSLSTAQLPESTFDVITMWDVLEHLPSPKQAFQKSLEILKPGGICVFSIPNLASFDRYIFGKYWIGWDPPRHFHLFSAQTLQQLVAMTGFQIEAKKCILGGKGTFLLSLDLMIQQGKFRPGTKKIYPLLSAILWPYRQLSYLLTRGPIITYVLRKPLS